MRPSQSKPWVYPSRTARPQTAFSGWPAACLQQKSPDATQPGPNVQNGGTWELVPPAPAPPPLPRQPQPCDRRTQRDLSWAPVYVDAGCWSPRQPSPLRTDGLPSRAQLGGMKTQVTTGPPVNDFFLLNKAASPWAKVLALRWSSSILPTISSRAIFPAAAMMPACRIPPPRAFRHRTAWDMKSFGPASMVPTGAPKPCSHHVCNYCLSTRSLLVVFTKKIQYNTIYLLF